MPFAAGNFTLVSTGNPVVTGSVISSSWANSTLNDISAGLSTTMLKDGTQTLTANIPFGGFKITGLAAGTTAGDSIRYEQVVGAYLPITGGTLTGNLLFTDATYDIGASGATRPRNIFLSGNATVGGTLGVTGHVTLEGVTSTGAQGSGALVFATSPTLTTPTLTSAVLNTGVSGTAIATSAELKTGTSSTKVPTPAGILAGMGFTAYFESAAQTITAAGALTLAHGLGRVPIFVQVVLICTVGGGELGYAQNDILLQPCGVNDVANSRGVSIVPDATNLNIRFGSAAGTFGIMRKDTGVGVAITNASWTVTFRAWA